VKKLVKILLSLAMSDMRFGSMTSQCLIKSLAIALICYVAMINDRNATQAKSKLANSSNKTCSQQKGTQHPSWQEVNLKESAEDLSGEVMSAI
jgi:hypothetical protein